jgi:hypothetical protein
MAEKNKTPTISGTFFPGESSFLLEKKKRGTKENQAHFQRSELLDSSIACAHSPHAIKVFEVGVGEELFSKSSSPITRLGSRLRGNDTARN